MYFRCLPNGREIGARLKPELGQLLLDVNCGLLIHGQQCFIDKQQIYQEKLTSHGLNYGYCAYILDIFSLSKQH